MTGGLCRREEPSAIWPEMSFQQLPGSVSDSWFEGKEFTSDWVLAERCPSNQSPTSFCSRNRVVGRSLCPRMA